MTQNRMMKPRPTFAFRLLSLLAVASFCCAQNDRPTVLTCTANAKASRDYGFQEKEWMGTVGGGASHIFGVGTKRTPNAEILRDRVFSGLNTARPAIRSITQSGTGQGDSASEFVGTVLSRAFDSVWITWKNPAGNKVWLSVINLKHKRAVITELFEGATSVGGQLETLDCR